MKLRIVQFISVVLMILVTGGFWGTWFSLTRSLEAFPVKEFIHNGQVIIQNVASPMRIIFPLCIIFTLWTLWLTRRNNPKGFYFTLVCLICLIVALLITLLVEVPIDNQIKTWTGSSVPSDWKMIRAKWGTYHEIRTFFSLAGICFYMIPIIFYGYHKQSQGDQ